jgi:tetratricopeptide (TPR) repeat protein
MRWQEGYLRFADLHPRSPGKVAIRASTDSVLMEAARRLDELHELVGSPSLDPMPRLTAGDGAGGYVHLTPLDWEVLAEVDGKRSLRGIALALSRPQLEVARSLYNLTDSGVVELGGSAQDRLPEIDPEALLGRIDAALEERRIDDAWALVNEARGAVNHQELLIREGRIAALMSDWDAALQLFERASAEAPGRADIQYYLARVLLLQLDLAGAERALKRYMEMGDASERRNISAIRMVESIQELRKTAAESTP